MVHLAQERHAPGSAKTEVEEAGAGRALKARRLKVVMVGPGVRSGGGMWTVASTLLGALEPHADMCFIETTAAPDASWAVKLRCAIAASLRFGQALVTWRPDVVHVHFASGSSIRRKLPFMVLARWMRVPVLAHLHGGAFDRYIESGEAYQVARVRRALRRVSLLVAVDRRGVNLLQTWLGLPDDRFTIIPNCAQAPRGEPTRSVGDSARFAFIGRLSSEKGLDVLLDVWDTVATASPGSVLELAGDGPLRERAIACSAEDPSIVVLGQIDPVRRDELLLRTDVLVLPSLVENVPLVVLEAMAAGLPVVVSSVGGVPELVEDGRSGVLIDPGDPGVLAGAMCDLALDAGLRARMGACAEERAARFSVESVTARLLDAYTYVVGVSDRERARR